MRKNRKVDAQHVYRLGQNTKFADFDRQCYIYGYFMLSVQIFRGVMGFDLVGLNVRSYPANTIYFICFWTWFM